MPFVKATSEDVKNLVLNVWGLPKEGKTHLALTGTDPTWWLNLDYGIRELLQKFKAKDLRVADFEMTEETDAGTYGVLLEQFHSDYLEALNTPGPGTIVVDTATQVWQIIQKVKLDAIKQQRSRGGNSKDARIFPFDYADANTYMGGLIRRGSQQTQKDVVWINRARERYDSSGNASGVYEFQGFRETPALVQATVQIIKRDGPGGTGGTPVWVARIDNNRFDPGLDGLEIDNPSLPLLKAILLGED